MIRLYSYGRATTVTTIRRMRKIPRGGIAKVTVGELVNALDIVAAVERPEQYRLINLAEKLRIKPTEVMSYLVKREGDSVEEGEVLASRRIFRLLSAKVVAPINGWVASIDLDKGRLLLEGEVTRQEVYASVPGRIILIKPDEHVIVETEGTLIQAAWAHGHPAWGTLKVMDGEPVLGTPLDRLNIEHQGAVVAIGTPLTKEFLEGAAAIHVKGLIAGSMHASLVPQVEEVDFPVVLTQGFGQLPMDRRILTVLSTNNGRELSIDTGRDEDRQMRRPEIIIPVKAHGNVTEERGISKGLQVGHQVRVLQSPYLGQIGTVLSLSPEPRQLKSGLWAPGAQVEMPSGESIYVPLANLEYLS